jgi:hypothetical protein
MAEIGEGIMGFWLRHEAICFAYRQTISRPKLSSQQTVTWGLTQQSELQAKEIKSKAKARWKKI